jgi:hypothetical protein
MLTLKSLNLDKPLSVFLAIEFAEKALPVWEEKYPKDSRPRKAIEAAKEWLSNPSDAAADTAADVSFNATAAAAAASANAAYAASDYIAAAYAAYAARDAAANAAYPEYAYRAVYAARALEVDKKSLIHEVILENLCWILQYKIENGQNFAQPELILGYLTEEQKQRFLFNLDAVA